MGLSDRLLSPLDEEESELLATEKDLFILTCQLFLFQFLVCLVLSIAAASAHVVAPVTTYAAAAPAYTTYAAAAPAYTTYAAAAPAYTTYSAAVAPVYTRSVYSAPSYATYSSSAVVAAPSVYAAPVAVAPATPALYTTLLKKK
uniref:Cuticle protein 16.5-like n=1 Tax=Stomoxys calcitrans TaxID=35570 RepID=A0A1I8PH92_STOCA